MSTPLRVLIVEDSPEDAELILRELRRGDYEPSYRCVDSADGMVAALDGQAWDVILCDYTMAGFSGTQALSFVRSRRIDVPFIFVSGTIGEDTAVAAMRAGAQDYVVKDKMRRLVPAIERELREAKTRRDHARAEADRQAAEARFREILEMAPDAIVAVDEDQRITVYNGAAESLFGYSAAEVDGQLLDLLIPSRFAAAHRKHLAAFAEGPVGARRMNARGDVFGRRKTGEEFPAEASISKIVENGKVTFLAVIRDVTTRRLLEEQLRQAQKMEAVGQLTGGLAHDFNNLLTIIIGNLELLEGNYRSAEQARETIAMALRASLQGAQLTRQLLAFSRQQSLEAKTFDLNQLVGGTTDLLRRTLGGQVEIVMNLAPALDPVLADPSQVESALVNMAINARDAMDGNGTLTIETANTHLDAEYAATMVEVTPGDYVMLAVSDTGSGMPPDVLEKAFEPFFTTKDQGKGTGLGLSMIYGFAKQSGGHVRIYSEVDHGTTIRLYLPRARDAAAMTATTSAAPDDEDRVDATVLVVEDNADVRAMAVNQLKALGYRVLEAENAATALDIIAGDAEIDLLFTDVVMPGGMSGVELAQEARRLRPGLRALFTSGYAEAALRNGNRVGGGESILSKPYRRDELTQKVRDALKRPPSA